MSFITMVTVLLFLSTLITVVWITSSFFFKSEKEIISYGRNSNICLLFTFLIMGFSKFKNIDLSIISDLFLILSFLFLKVGFKNTLLNNIKTENKEYYRLGVFFLCYLVLRYLDYDQFAKIGMLSYLIIINLLIIKIFFENKKRNFMLKIGMSIPFCIMVLLFFSRLLEIMIMDYKLIGYSLVDTKNTNALFVLCGMVVYLIINLVLVSILITKILKKIQRVIGSS